MISKIILHPFFPFNSSKINSWRIGHIINGDMTTPQREMIFKKKFPKNHQLWRLWRLWRICGNKTSIHTPGHDINNIYHIPHLTPINCFPITSISSISSILTTIMIISENQNSYKIRLGMIWRVLVRV